MPTFVHLADGTKTVFNCATSAFAKTVRVNGAVVVPQATANGNVTFAAAPVRGAVVEIFYAPLNGADPTLPLGNANYVPMAVECGYKPVITPVVRYSGLNADAAVFTLDPLAKAVEVRVDSAWVLAGSPATTIVNQF
jgi:hypothetical protein